MNGGQYNDVLANDTYLVAVVKDNLHDIWLVEFLADLHKANFILSFLKSKPFKTLRDF
jgi:hypothetical protein